MTDPSSLVPGNRVDEFIATVALIRSPRRPVPVDQLASLIDHRGSAVELARLRLEDVLFSSPEVNLSAAEMVSDADVSRAAEDVRNWLDRGMDSRLVLDPHYPSSLHSIFNKPPLVFVRGSWREHADRRSVAVVGTRKATAEGLSRARRLARELVEAGYTIVSGLAAGIDTAAHASALDAGGRTVAVMGTGLDHIYPSANRPLASRIVESGCALVTQFLPDQTPRRWTFPARNVVMSGLSMATIVVEAGETSGARMQARVALQHGRTVFLLKSLVAAHEWAGRLVDEGIEGSRAIVIAHSAEVVDRLDAPNPDPVMVSA